MKSKLLGRCLGAAAIVSCLTLGPAAGASEIDDRVEIHGYGYQSFLRSSGNPFLDADKSGTWINNTLALVFTARLDEKSKLWSQIHSNTEETRLEWAFVDYQFSDRVNGRAGKIRLPVGLYNEIRDVRSLQLSTLPPFIYQEASGMVSESFSGVSALYNQAVGRGALVWETYFGQLDPIDDETMKFRRLAGARLTWNTPIDGLRFMASAHESGLEDQSAPIKGRMRLGMLSADYTIGAWDLKSEFALRRVLGVPERTGYLQAGYAVDDRWTPYFRYDYVTTDTRQRKDPSYYQRTATVGIGYRLSDQVSLRAENHFNRGYALPVLSGEVEKDMGEYRWNLFSLAINFLF